MSSPPQVIYFLYSDIQTIRVFRVTPSAVVFAVSIHNTNGSQKSVAFQGVTSQPIIASLAIEVTVTW